jgi:dienelactone hydrolase
VQLGVGPEIVNLVSNGPYTVSTYPASGSGFASGTVHYPTDVGEAFGGLLVIPGYQDVESSIKYLGPSIASHGFVVATLNSLQPEDLPDDRGMQLIAARQWLQVRVPASLPARCAIHGRAVAASMVERWLQQLLSNTWP